MDRKLALSLFLGICVLLAILLILRVINTLMSGSIFALALLLFGGPSRGFRKTSHS